MKYSLKELVNGNIILTSIKRNNVFGLLDERDYILLYHDRYDILVLYDRKECSLKKVDNCQHPELIETLNITKSYYEDYLNDINFLKKRYHLEMLIKYTSSNTNLDNIIDLFKIEQENTKDSIAKLVKNKPHFCCSGLSEELDKRLELANKIARGI